eukprot:TRINITY_DN29412_c0_g1_i1.p1 TRINITY_DN29412_c0_g1~~TRINITY_DN29412_c0_g1_i1.p1  ORF type:complete len:445 (-),score=66.94 TRINITY_DN29412_c0_g1_i1:291-1625(-)
MKPKTSVPLVVGLVCLFLLGVALLGRAVRPSPPCVCGGSAEEEEGSLLVSGGSQKASCTTARQCAPHGTENLPPGIMAPTADLYFRRLHGEPKDDLPAEGPPNTGLLAIAAGYKQKETVNQIVQKFPLANFSVMLFHYDGVVDAWSEFPWSDSVIHVAVKGQGKWWYAKRFLHPDVVAPYKWLFLFDDDLGVEYFDAFRYMELAEEAGFEISQPALRKESKSIHHRFFVLRPTMNFHKTFFRKKGKWKCSNNTLDPPCAGWVEVMAPVFRGDAWRCFWHLIQPDLVHGWGLDRKIGYCTKGLRSDAIGVIDGVSIVHDDAITLGSVGIDDPQTEDAPAVASGPPCIDPKEGADPDHPDDEDTFGADNVAHLSTSLCAHGKRENASLEGEPLATSPATLRRISVRRRAVEESLIFRARWRTAAKSNHCWKDRYENPNSDASRLAR